MSLKNAYYIFREGEGYFLLDLTTDLLSPKKP